MTTTTNCRNSNNASTASNIWFGSASSSSSSSDRIKTVRNRALYRNTMQIAALGGLKRVGGLGGSGGSGGSVFEPATRLNGACVSLPGETGANGCASFFIRSAPSYENLLRVTQGMYEGRRRAANLPPAPTNADTVSRLTPSNPLSASYRYNYLGAASDNDILILSAVSSSAAVFDAAKKQPVDAAHCMQYPPNPNVSITYGRGGCAP